MVGILALPDAFHFHVQEEPFGNGVIPAIVLAAHAADEAVLGQQILAKCARVRAAPVRMDDQARRRLALLDRHCQRVADQFGGHARRRGPTYDIARVQVQHRGQAQPSCVRVNVSDIADVRQIRRGRIELSIEYIRRYRQVVLAVGRVDEFALPDVEC